MADGSKIHHSGFRKAGDDVGDGLTMGPYVPIHTYIHTKIVYSAVYVSILYIVVFHTRTGFYL